MKQTWSFGCQMMPSDIRTSYIILQIASRSLFLFWGWGGCFLCLFVFKAVGLCRCDLTHQPAWKLCFFKMMRRESGQRAILEVGCSLCTVFYWLKQIITLNFDWVSKVHIWISWAYSCCQLGCTHKNRICSVFLWYTWDSCWCCVSVKLEEMLYFYQGQSDKVCSFLHFWNFGDSPWTWLNLTEVGPQAQKGVWQGRSRGRCNSDLSCSSSSE